MLDIPNIVAGAVRGAIAEAVPQVVLPQIAEKVEQARLVPPSEPLPPQARPAVDIDAVVAAVAEKLRQQPAFQAAMKETASVPWWQSPVTIGSAVASSLRSWESSVGSFPRPISRRSWRFWRAPRRRSADSWRSWPVSGPVRSR